MVSSLVFSRFIGGIRRYIFEFFRLHDLFAIEKKTVENIRENVIPIQKRFFSDILFAQKNP